MIIHKPNFNLSNIQGLYHLSMNPQMAKLVMDRIAPAEEEPFFILRYFNGVFFVRFNLPFGKILMQEISDQEEMFSFNCIVALQFSLENTRRWNLSEDFFLEKLKGLLGQLDRDTWDAAVPLVGTIQLPWKGAEILTDLLAGSENYFLTILHNKLKVAFSDLKARREEREAEPAPKGYAE